jgi:VIT1/CCC1 family predicted Fe2+/Mn2+ transporter
MTVPVAVVLVTVGIFLYRWQIVSYSVGSLLCIGTLYCFYRTKQPWLYYYTVVLVGLTLAIFTLLGGEI